ncbi:MAG: TRAP transporter small permease subunit [Desulfohalobiaceae bacterium]
MNVLNKILYYCEVFIEWTGRVVCWLIFILMALAVFEVVTRRLLGNPTVWTFEMSGFLLAGTTMLGLAYTQLHYGHVNIDFIYDRLSRRAQAILNIITFFPYLFLYCYIFLHLGTKFAAKSWARLETASTAWSPPVYPVKTVLPVGAALLLLIGLVQLIQNIIIAVKGKES